MNSGLGLSLKLCVYHSYLFTVTYSLEISGGHNRARTCDPLLVRQVLSQLSYAPTNGDPTGTRTRVTAVKGRCLNRLTIGPKKTGNVLLSRAVARRVLSAQGSLTTVFGMGTGVTSPL